MTHVITTDTIGLPSSSTGYVSSALLHLRCPSCSQYLATIDVGRDFTPVDCQTCGFKLRSQASIWKALSTEREKRFRRFVAEYEAVRKREGRGSPHGAFYLHLPYQDLTGRNTWQWKIRSRSFDCFLQRLLPAIERKMAHGLRILDIGAGNCWLSYRLATRGHHLVAVDLLDNNEDGLGAATHYFTLLHRPFARFQAEMDRMPFAPSQFDLAIFNASFHYSQDYELTLRETLRCLRRPGHVVIIDSPFYYRDDSGQQMVAEKQSRFEAQHGFRADSVSSREYLTPAVLDQLGRSFSLTWRVLKPWYGIEWALRPFKARMLGRREPSKFFIFFFEVGSQ